MIFQTLRCGGNSAVLAADCRAPAYLAAIAIALICFGLLSACAAMPSFDVTWSLQDDASAFRQEFRGSAAMAHRVGEVEEALSSNAYARFRNQVERAPPAHRAIVYYEAASSVSHYYFALALEGEGGCRLYVSDQQGSRDQPCAGVDEVTVSPDDDTRLILDPGVAVLVQFQQNGETARRSLRLLDDTTKLADADSLFARVRRIFSD